MSVPYEGDVFLITTAGTDTQSICYERHQKVKDILEGQKFAVLPYFWIPAKNIDLRVRRDHVPYDVMGPAGISYDHRRQCSSLQIYRGVH